MDPVMSWLLNFLSDYFLYFPILLFTYLLIRYFIISGAVYFLLWVAFKKFLANRRIQQNQIKNTQIFYEIKNSIISFAVMSVICWPLYYFFMIKKTAIYLKWSDYPKWCVAASLLIAFLWHDIYFFFSHKWLHGAWAYKSIHYVHHQSKIPTPFASHSMHWIEGVIQILFIFPIVFLLPMHPWTFVAFMLISHFFATWGHFNYELMPMQTWNSWWGRWITTSTHHNDHHKYSTKGNYALYLKFWDIKFQTLNQQTEVRFKKFKTDILEEPPKNNLV